MDEPASPGPGGDPGVTPLVVADGGEPPRRNAIAVDLGDGRRLVVRPVEAADADGLFDLYDQLDDADRWMRLRIAGLPAPSFFSRLASPTAGDAGVVAELCAATGRRIVGEAGYRMRASGNGDLGIVVASRWRGLTGPLLLEQLLAHAASCGVPNLEADVLLRDAPMLALLHHRGAAVVEHDRFDLVRMRIGTTGRVPTWDGSGPGRRVLIEAPGGRGPDEDDLRTAGFAVLTCHGPRRQRGCPAIEGEPCPLAAAADVIVAATPEGDDCWQRLLAGHGALHPRVPVVPVLLADRELRPGEVVAAVTASSAGPDRRRG